MPVSSDDERGEHRHAGRRAVLRDARRPGRGCGGRVFSRKLLLEAEPPGVRPRTKESAACADSFITSPSWPVSVQLALAGHPGRLDEEDVAADAASRRGRSRRPAPRVRSATSLMNFGGAEELVRSSSCVDASRGCAFALGDLDRDAADDAGDLALEVAHAGLARVAVDDLARRAPSVDRRAARSSGRARSSCFGTRNCSRDRELLLRGCSRGARGSPGGRAAAAGSGPSRFAVAMNITLRQVERHLEVVIGEACCSARGRAPRAAPPAGSPRKSCPSLSISSSMKTGLFGAGLLHALDDAARAARRRRCGGGRGSRPRRARRRARCGRTCARARARSSGRATSCRRRAGRRGRGSGPSCRCLSLRTARYSRMRFFTFSRP